MRPTIRFATATDLPRILELAQHFIAQTVYATRLGVNLVALEALGRQLLDANNCCILVAVLDDAVIGMLGMTVYPHPMSGEIVGAEVMWWVEPESRGCGVELLCAGEQWAREHGATCLHMVAPTPEVATLYARLDFEPIETVYQRRIH